MTEAETIVMTITIDNAGDISDTRMATAINKIYKYATRLFPELLNKMNSPVRVRITRETRPQNEEPSKKGRYYDGR